MDVNNTETTDTYPSTNTRSVFFCPQYPHLPGWDLKSTTTSWILVFVLAIASPVTTLSNLLVIIAVKRRKELQKPVNILLSSMAVADLLVGAILMPLSATVNILILRQVLLQHVCTLYLEITLPLFLFLCSSSMYHLTAVAGERYVAIQKSIQYKVIVTKGLLKKVSIASWLLALFLPLGELTLAVVEVDREIMEICFIIEGVIALICLITIAYFYIMVYLGVRKRKISELSQVNALTKAKLESKVAKTTGLLTASLILSFLPAIGMLVLGNVISVFKTNSFFHLGESLMQLNSLVSPILYCYRDRHFRKAVLELLGIRKPHVFQPGDGVARFLKRNESYGSVKRLQKSVACKRSRELKPKSSSSIRNGSSHVCMQPRMARSASCDAAIFVDCVRSHAKPHEIFMKRKLSASI